MSKFITRRDFLKVSAVGALGAAASAAMGTALAAEAKAIYTPGTYSASEQGLESLVTVTMTFDETSIVDVIVDSGGETAEIGAAAAGKLAEQLMNAQGSDIDGVTGASITSDAVKKAAANCVAQAMGLAVEAEAAPAEETAAPGDDWLGEEPEISDADVYDEASADVIVVGLGLAGVSAARAAAEMGATVIGIDGAAAPQCRSGEFAVINSPTLNARWPERALTAEEVAEIVDSHVNESGYRVKRPITAKWAANIGEAFDWYMGADENLFIADETRQPIEDENAGDFLVPIFRPLPVTRTPMAMSTSTTGKRNASPASRPPWSFCPARPQPLMPIGRRLWTLEKLKAISVISDANLSWKTVDAWVCTHWMTTLIPLTEANI